MRIRMLIALAVLASLAGTAPLQAKLPWVKKAQGLGFKEIQNCASCHSSEKPKKGDPMGERGQWLVDQKKAKHAEEVDLAWLKDFKPKK